MTDDPELQRIILSGAAGGDEESCPLPAAVAQPAGVDGRRIDPSLDPPPTDSDRIYHSADDLAKAASDLILNDGTRVRDGRINNGRKPGVLNSDDPEHYQHKKLAGDHLVMCEMHMAGFTNKEVAEHLGCVPQTVSNVINSDLGKEFVLNRAKAMDQQFFALYGSVISTIRDGLDPEIDLSIRLVAADKWLKAHGRYSPKQDESAKVTAEDIVARLLEKGGGGGVTIRDSQVVIQSPAEPKQLPSIEQPRQTKAA